MIALLLLHAELYRNFLRVIRQSEENGSGLNKEGVQDKGNTDFTNTLKW